MVAHAYNPSTLGGQGRWIMRSRDRDHPGQQGETPSLLQIQKLAGHGLRSCSPSYSGGWGRRIAWTQEAEVGGWHEPGRWRLQWAEITPLHRARTCLKKKKVYFLPEWGKKGSWEVILSPSLLQTGTSSAISLMRSSSFWEHIRFASLRCCPNPNFMIFCQKLLIVYAGEL